MDRGLFGQRDEFVAEDVTKIMFWQRENRTRSHPIEHGRSPARRGSPSPPAQRADGHADAPFSTDGQIIADFSTSRSNPNHQLLESATTRWPGTAEHIEKGFGLHVNEVSKYLGSPIKEKKTRAECRKDVIYYHAATREVIRALTILKEKGQRYTRQ